MQILRTMEQIVNARLANAGGRLQREALLDGRESSKLAGALIDLWSWGALSAPMLQMLASAAACDVQAARDHGLHFVDLDNLARLGAHGQFPNNTRRDLMRSLSSTAHQPTPLLVRIPYVNHKADKNLVQYTDVPVLMPNELFDCMFHHFRPHFDTLLQGDLSAFWRNVSMDDPKMQHNPLLDESNFANKYVPMTVFGDAVAYTTAGNSLHTLCWGGLLGSGWSWKSVFLLALLPKVCCCSVAKHGVSSLNEIWAYIRLGFEALFRGQHPLTDIHGEPWPANSWQAHLAGRDIAGGTFRGVVWTIAADLEYAANQFGVNHWSALQPCLHCDARRDDPMCNVRDVSEHAAWRSTLRAPEHRGVSDHEIWSIPGISAFSYVGDWMHTCDLGVLTYMHASVCHDLIDADGPLGGAFDITRRVERLWVAIQKHYDLTGTTKRLANLTVGMLGGKGAVFPSLACKANESRHLVKPMLSLLREMNKGDRASLHRLRAYECLDEACMIVNSTPEFFLNDRQWQNLWRSANEFVLHYNWLTNYSIERGASRYSPAYKVHAFLHICQYAKHLHPRASWCYVYEDFIGRIKRLAVSSARGTSMHRLPRKVVAQYLVALTCVMTGFLASEKN
jgi:hypothetical protein